MTNYRIARKAYTNIAYGIAIRMRNDELRNSLKGLYKYSVWHRHMNEELQNSLKGLYKYSVWHRRMNEELGIIEVEVWFWQRFALGIGAASFASDSEQRYSGKPDGVAGTPKGNK